MNEERTVSVTLTVAYIGWAVSLSMFVLAVGIFLATDGIGRGPVIIAEGACIVSAMAATAHIKHFSEGVCRVFRDRDELAADIRQLRSR